MDGKITLHGHRGSRGTHVENTIPSFREAARAGADFIEMDLQLSADNVPVVYHDPVLSGRLCYHPKEGILKYPLAIRQLNAQEIKSYHCGTYVDPRFPNQELVPNTPIPLLEDVFVWQKQEAPHVGLNLEIKMKPGTSIPIDPALFGKTILQLAYKHKIKSKIFIQSFDRKVLQFIRNTDREIHLSRLYRVDNRIVERALRNGYPTVSISYQLLTEPMISTFHNNNIEVLVYTVNKEQNWKRLIDLGVNGIITDYPAKLAQYLSTNS